jgi:hypothetical protein
LKQQLLHFGIGPNTSDESLNRNLTEGNLSWSYLLSNGNLYRTFPNLFKSVPDSRGNEQPIWTDRDNILQGIPKSPRQLEFRGVVIGNDGAGFRS